MLQINRLVFLLLEHQHDATRSYEGLGNGTGERHVTLRTVTDLVLFNIVFPPCAYRV